MNSKASLISRLLPLNKIHPKVPEINKYRPIIISSPLVKFCEMICKEKLMTFCKQKIENEQTGFVSGFNTSFNLTRIMSNIWSIKKHKKKRKPFFMLFIDFKSAYDLVDRHKLYQILKKKQILNNSEIQLIKFLHQNSVISLGKSKCVTKPEYPKEVEYPHFFLIYS